MIEIVNILIDLIEHTKKSSDKKDMAKFRKTLEELHLELLNTLVLIKKLQMDNQILSEEKRELENQINILYEQLEMDFD